MNFEAIGWVGVGKANICIQGSDWGYFEPGLYSFNVEARSALFQTTTFTSFSFTLTSPQSSSFLSRQEPASCDPSLWDSSTSLYGIQTFPSGHNLFPSSLRSTPLTITTKALSPCPQIGFTKDILAPASFFWEFVGSVGDGVIDPNNWLMGTKLVIPETILKDREIFPPHLFVEMRVSVKFGDDQVFTSQVSIGFLPSPVEMEVQTGFTSIYNIEERLVLDFSDSYTLDGVVVGGTGWQWEWDWSCVIPGEIGGNGRECVYEDGEAVLMPSETEQRFMGEEGKRFEEGVPLFFSVRGRVREGDGEIITEGRWSGVINPVGGLAVGVEVQEEEWMCSDSSVGYQVSI